MKAEMSASQRSCWTSCRTWPSRGFAASTIVYSWFKIVGAEFEIRAKLPKRLCLLEFGA